MMLKFIGLVTLCAVVGVLIDVALAFVGYKGPPLGYSTALGGALGFYVLRKPK